MKLIFLDFETKSACDLKTAGVHRYAVDKTTDIYCMAYAIDDGAVLLWKSGDPLPKDFLDALEGDYRLVAHNFAFEGALWEHVLTPKYGFPMFKIENAVCTMAEAYAMALPASLEKCAIALGLEAQKDMKGSRIAVQVSQPRDVKEDGSFVWWEDPAKFEILYAYCIQDVEVQRQIYKRTLRLSAKEREIWLLDYKINARGIPCDLPAIENAMAIVEREKIRLNARMKKITDNAVGTCNATAQIVSFLDTRGINTKSIAKSELETLLLQDIPQDVRECLEIRQEAAKSSTAKLIAMKNRAGHDLRMRGLYQYSGARTRRFSGRGPQPQNFKRMAYKEKEINEIMAAMVANDEATLRKHGSLMQVISNSLRAFITASPGKILLGGDFSSIEARVLAWLAGQEDVLEIFRGHGKIYEHAASQIYHKPMAEVTPQERQIGKVACIAEGELVLTDKGLFPIEKLPKDTRVWDGVEWVTHDGPVFMGEKEVITYDGLQATEDHIVWTQKGHALCFGVCAREQIPLAETGIGREEVRFCDGDLPQDSLGGEKIRPARTSFPISRNKGSMFGLSQNKMDIIRQPFIGENERLPVVQPNHTSPIPLGAQTCLRYAQSLHKHQKLRVQELRATRNRVQVFIGEGGHPLDTTEFTTTPGERSGGFSPRPHRQQRSLRTRQLKVYHDKAKLNKSRVHSLCVFRGKEGPFGGRDPHFSFSVSACSIRGQHNSAVVSILKPVPDRASVPPRVFCKTKRKVWDVLNAGPRNRFTVSGRLVHNCLALGYGGGKGAFLNMAKNYGVVVSEAKAEEIKLKWREANAATVRYWYALNDAAIEAVSAPGTIRRCGPKEREVLFVRKGISLWCKLPSGGVISYPYAKVESVETPWGATRNAVTVMTELSPSRKWGREPMHGGVFAENVTQSLARDVLTEAMLRLETAGYPVTIHTHDEIVCEVDPTTNEANFKNLLTKNPDWSEGLPLAANVFSSYRYTK